MRIVDIHNHIDTLNGLLRLRGKLQHHLTNIRDYLPTQEGAQVLLSVSLYASFYQTFDHLIDLIQSIKKEIDSLGSDVQLIETNADLRKNFKLGLILHVESARLLKNYQSQLPQLFDYGVRGIIPVHFKDNQFGDSCDDPLRRLSLKKRNRGLTTEGEKIVKLCNDKGIWIDLTHTTDTTASDILSIAKKTMVSHIGIRELKNLKRNKPLAFLKKLSEKGGLIGLSPWTHLVGNSYKGHYEFAKNNALEDSICIGSDYGVPIKTEKTYSSLFKIASEIPDEKFLFKNAWNFFDRALDF